MRAVLQRVSHAAVWVGDRLAGEIDFGLLVLLGIARADTQAHADQLLEKVLSLRIFANLADSSGKFDLSLGEVGGSMLIVSQFTLLANTGKGRRPSFSEAAQPETAETLYDYFVQRARDSQVPTKTGEFGAHMSVHLVNDGPVTILLDTNDR